MSVWTSEAASCPQLSCKYRPAYKNRNLPHADVPPSPTCAQLHCTTSGVLLPPPLPSPPLPLSLPVLPLHPLHLPISFCWVCSSFCPRLLFQRTLLSLCVFPMQKVFLKLQSGFRCLVAKSYLTLCLHIHRSAHQASFLCLLEFAQTHFHPSQ